MAPLHPELQAPAIVHAEALESYAEIGVYEGDAVSAVASMMPDGGTVYLFDYEDVVRNVARRIEKEQGGRILVIQCPNSRKLSDSYNWSLMQWLQAKDVGRPFDYVYLDGAHTWNIDALAFLLIDRLLRPGGYVELDDVNWNHTNSLLRLEQQGRMELYGEMFDQWMRDMTDEQLSTCQVKLVIDLLVRKHPDYEEIHTDRLWRRNANATD